MECPGGVGITVLPEIAVAEDVAQKRWIILPWSEGKIEVTLLLSRPLKATYRSVEKTRHLRNFVLFEFALNGVSLQRENVSLRRLKEAQWLSRSEKFG